VRLPSTVIVVDASILLSATLGQSSSALLALGERLALVTTDRAVDEARRRLTLGMRRSDLLGALMALIGRLEVVALDDLGWRVPEAGRSLKEAPQSRNGSTRDAHILALAWEGDADIWGHDRDFAGTGVATWSTVNLIRAAALTVT
jgi:predicted nucleic acid-binding protein